MKRLVVVALTIACGGDAGSQAPAKPPPPSVLALQVLVASRGGDDTFCPALGNGLARSGLQVTNDESQPSDAVVTCAVALSEDTGFVRWSYNGRSKMHVTVRIDVRSAQNQSIVDSFITDYTGYRRGAPDEDAVAKTVVGFAYSPRIAAFARAVRRARAAGATQPTATTTATATAPPIPTATVENPPNDPRDDSEWFAIETVKCKIPARVEACDPVRRYLHRHPAGAHAAEANAILAAAQPALEKLQKDEVAWQKANRSLCASRRTSDACVGVEAYEVQFPTGLHAEEAHRLLKAAGVDK